MRKFKKQFTEEWIGDKKKVDLLKRKEVNFRIIHLKEGQVINPHPESYGVFFFIIKGESIFLSEEGESTLKEGSALYYEPGELRGIKPLTDLVLLGIQMLD